MLSIAHIDSSSVYCRSASRQLNNAVHHAMELFAPEGAVIKGDPNPSRIPPVAAAYTSEEARTPAGKEPLVLSDPPPGDDSSRRSAAFSARKNFPGNQWGSQKRPERSGEPEALFSHPLAGLGQEESAQNE
jgi:hypothetical protein